MTSNLLSAECRFNLRCISPQVREACQYEVKGGAENKQGKANVLLQVGGAGGARQEGVIAWRGKPVH